MTKSVLNLDLKSVKSKINTNLEHARHQPSFSKKMEKTAEKAAKRELQVANAKLRETQLKTKLEMLKDFKGERRT
jgi:hypothetical protein